LVFAGSGLIRGLVRQVFGLAGFAVGLWVVVEVAWWAGAHWQGARPSAVFWLLPWIVGALAGLAVATLFHWSGVGVRKALGGGPLGWLDRVLGLPFGALVGMAWAIALLSFLLLAPRSLGLSEVAGEGRTTRPLIGAGARACDEVEKRVPVLHEVGRLLHEAERRARAYSEST
jgi:hypothetical protein